MFTQLEELFTAALGIEKPWSIKSLNFNSEEKKLDIFIDFDRGSVFDYKDPETQEVDAYKAYDKIDKTWKHLNFFEHECYLHAKVPRVVPKSGGIKMVFPPWVGNVYGFTLLFESLILNLSKNMPVHQVAKLLKTTDHKVWHVLECYTEKAIALADNSNVQAIGMDETSVKKGHNYITLFVDMNQKKTIFVTEGKDHKTVTDFADMLEGSHGNRENIIDVSCDMSPAFIKGVTTELPNAEITFDKFHIIKKINEAVDSIRKEEVKTQIILKSKKSIVLKNNENLTPKQRIDLESISKLNLKTIRALHIRENFQKNSIRKTRLLSKLGG